MQNSRYLTWLLSEDIHILSQLALKLFTAQCLDTTGLYYYNARYYDPTIGRFISADTIIPSPADPQCFNRYSYCLNNPLKYTDPSGHNVLNWLIRPGYENMFWVTLLLAAMGVSYYNFGAPALISLQDQTGYADTFLWIEVEYKKNLPPIWVPPPSPPTYTPGSPTNPLAGGWPSGSGPKKTIVKILIALGLTTLVGYFSEKAINPDVDTQGPIPKNPGSYPEPQLPTNNDNIPPSSDKATLQKNTYPYLYPSASQSTSPASSSDTMFSPSDMALYYFFYGMYLMGWIK